MRSRASIVPMSSILLGLAVLVLMSGTTLSQAQQQHEIRHGGRRKPHNESTKHTRTSSFPRDHQHMQELRKSSHRKKSNTHQNKKEEMEKEKEKEKDSRQLARGGRGSRGREGGRGRGKHGNNGKTGNNGKARGSGGTHRVRNHVLPLPPPPPPPPPPKIITSWGHSNFAPGKRPVKSYSRVQSNWGSSIGLHIDQIDLPGEPNPPTKPTPNPPPTSKRPTPSPTTTIPVNSPPTRQPSPPPTNTPPVSVNPPPTNAPPPPTNLPTPSPVAPSPTLPPTIAEHYIPKCDDGCEFDEQCGYGTSCLYIEAASMLLPGCNGATGMSSKAYCITPPSSDIVVVVADNTPRYQEYAAQNNLSSNPYPLGECQGDCDTDDDCAGTLRCLERFNDEEQLEETLEFAAVPGCRFYNENLGAVGKDYCFDATSFLFFVGNDLPNAPGPSNLNACEGDCDSDDDCAGDLRCFERSELYPATVPGCENGSPYPDFNSGVNILDAIDFCYDATGFLSYVSANGANEPIVPFAAKDSQLINTGLGECQGDCDRDSDCRGSLVCFETQDAFDVNTGLVSVPGCTDPNMAASMEGFDFCCNPLDPQTGAACLAGSSR